jgi:predicted  nucleic acid-binding Zn-ribbon protein
MTDEPEDLTLRMLRRIDEKLDRVIDDVHDLKVRMTAVELAIARVNDRIDRVDQRLDRIERRLDLVDSPT